MSDIWIKYSGGQPQCEECGEAIGSDTYEVFIRFRESGNKICLCFGCLIKLYIDAQDKFADFKKIEDEVDETNA